MCTANVRTFALFFHHFLNIFISVLSIGLIFVASAGADAIFFVNGANGDDGNSGAQTRPLATIQRAVDMARSGDTVVIAPGTYHESIAIRNESGINRNGITIEGQDKNSVIIDGQTTGSSWGIHASGVSGVTIKDLTIQDVNYGIFLRNASNNSLQSVRARNNRAAGVLFYYHSNNNRLVQCDLEMNHIGVLLQRSSDNLIANNRIVSNTLDGIRAWIESHDNTFHSNTTQNNRYDGIYIHSSRGNKITGNIVEANGRHGISLTTDSEHTSVFGNTFRSNVWYALFLNARENIGNRARFNNFYDVGRCHIVNGVGGTMLDVRHNYYGGQTPAQVAAFVDGAGELQTAPFFERPVSGDIHFVSALRGDDSFRGDFAAPLRRIQDAVNQASAQDVIVVEEGTYPESVVVTSDHLTIIGDGPFGTSVVDVANPVNGHGFSLSGRTGTVIDNLCVKNAAYGVLLVLSTRNTFQRLLLRDNAVSGIAFVRSSHDNTLMDSIVTGSQYGVQIVSRSNRNNVLHNTISENRISGVRIWIQSHENVVSANHIHDQSVDGIYVHSSFGNTIIGNRIEGSRRYGVALTVETRDTRLWANTFVQGRNHSVMINGGTGGHTAIRHNHFQGGVGHHIYNDTTTRIDGQRNLYTDMSLQNVSPRTFGPVQNTVMRSEAVSNILVVDAQNGDDMHDGSHAHPLASIATAVSRAEPSDIILLMSGNHNLQGNLLMNKHNVGLVGLVNQDGQPRSRLIGDVHVRGDKVFMDSLEVKDGYVYLDGVNGASIDRNVFSGDRPYNLLLQGAYRNVFQHNRFVSAHSYTVFLTYKSLGHGVYRGSHDNVFFENVFSHEDGKGVERFIYSLWLPGTNQADTFSYRNDFIACDFIEESTNGVRSVIFDDQSWWMTAGNGVGSYSIKLQDCYFNESGTVHLRFDPWMSPNNIYATSGYNGATPRVQIQGFAIGPRFE